MKKSGLALSQAAFVTYICAFTFYLCQQIEGIPSQAVMKRQCIKAYALLQFNHYCPVIVIFSISHTGVIFSSFIHDIPEFTLFKQFLHPFQIVFLIIVFKTYPGLSIDNALPYVVFCFLNRSEMLILQVIIAVLLMCTGGIFHSDRIR